MNDLRAPEQDVVMSSRVRLARNYQDIPFAPHMNAEYAQQTIERTSHTVLESSDGQNFRLMRMSELSEDERNRLVEHHLISYDLLKFSDYSAALISSGETVSIMINEEDHLRIQGLLPGMQLERSAELAFKADDTLGTQQNYAFDPQWGYLTSCPTNTGTGMRASAMLHLPALTAAGRISAIVQMVSKLGLTVRGFYGEGSDAMGCLYQLSNQVTLGRTEEDTIKTLSVVTLQIAAQERALREQMHRDDPDALLDKLMRSIALLANARIMGQKEFMQRYSDMRLAASLKLIDASLSEIDHMMMDLQNASLCVRAGHEMNDRQRDKLRADLLRAKLKEILTKQNKLEG